MRINFRKGIMSSADKVQKGPGFASFTLPIVPIVVPIDSLIFAVFCYHWYKLRLYLSVLIVVFYLTRRSRERQSSGYCRNRTANSRFRTMRGSLSIATSRTRSTSSRHWCTHWPTPNSTVWLWLTFMQIQITANWTTGASFKLWPGRVSMLLNLQMWPSQRQHSFTHLLFAW